MEGIFDVTLDGQVVGMVEVKREGLYCRISCRCRVADQEIHRLYADSEKIGVLLPKNGEQTLETKVAAKRLKERSVFTLDGIKTKFIPIRPGKAFGHLDKLRKGKMVFQNGTPGVKI